MNVKACLFAIPLCCMLPFIAQGVDLDDHNEPKPPPRVPLKSVLMSPVTFETESGMLTLYFMSNLGEVNVFLQGVTGKVAYQMSVDTSVQNQAFFTIPAGTYALTITDASGNVIKQESLIIP